MAITTVDPIEMSYLDALFQAIMSDMETIELSREYYRGIQEIQLTDRAKEFLGLHDDNQFRLNICQTIVNALSNELTVISFDTNEQVDENKEKPQAIWANDLADQNKFGQLQDDVHEATLADRETFVIAEWDEEKGHVVWTQNQRLVDVQAGGDGMGVWMSYENDDPRQKPKFAVKQWIETQYDVNNTPHTYIFRTVYYPDRMERFYYDYGWQPYEGTDPETGEILAPAVESWVDREGNPLGIPVAHFINRKYQSEHWEAIPSQDAVNKTLLDILAANDLTAFKMFFGFGFYPTTDGEPPNKDNSNLMKVGPAQFNGTSKKPQDASLQEVEGADNSPLVDFLVELILLVCSVTDTPVSRFITTAQVASAETILAQKQALRDKAEDRRGRFGDSWANLQKISRRITNAFSGTGLNENIEFMPTWKSDKTLDEISQKIEVLGITQEQAWKEIGYSPDVIDEMKSSVEYLLKFYGDIFAGYDVASQQGISFENYLIMLKIPEDEMNFLVESRGTATPPISQ